MPECDMHACSLNSSSTADLAMCTPGRPVSAILKACLLSSLSGLIEGRTVMLVCATE